MKKRSAGMEELSRCSFASGQVSDHCYLAHADLQYADSTWEVYDEIREGAQAAIDEFHTREKSVTVPARSASGPRPAYEKISSDPSYLGGELKPFQLLGLNWMAYLWHTNQSGILADEASPHP
jgi:chromodomain-helicase-DNA-binding protein 1